jgi:uncharacterized OB-fold protein
LSSTRPVDAGLFADGPAPRLVGGRHRATGRIVFPMPADPDSFEPCVLPTRGRLWSYTIQRFAPKSPPYGGAQPFEPFAVGYVELPDAVIVESRLTDVDFAELAVGMAVELTTTPLRTDPDGTVVTTFAFRPVRGA